MEEINYKAYEKRAALLGDLKLLNEKLVEQNNSMRQVETRNT